MSTTMNNLPALSNEGGLSTYLEQIKKFPMLAAEEESGHLLFLTFFSKDTTLGQWGGPVVGGDRR